MGLGIVLLTRARDDALSGLEGPGYIGDRGIGARGIGARGIGDTYRVLMHWTNSPHRPYGLC